MDCRKLTGFTNRAFLAAMGSITVCLMLSGSGFAQLTNHSTVVTVGQPIEVAGSSPQVLPAGTYLFKVLDSQGNRNIVQISNKDETHVYTTILAIPIHRDEESDKTILTFDERPAGQPPALRAWFYPFDKNGQEFVYPKEMASQLARTSNSTVPYSDSKVETTPAVAGAARSEIVGSAPPAPIMAVTPAGATVQPAYPQSNPAPVASAARPAPASAQNPERPPVQIASLPQTGSEMPLLALFGSCSVFAGVSIKVIRALCVR
jgi:hypothetical protein